MAAAIITIPLQIQTATGCTPAASIRLSQELFSNDINTFVDKTDDQVKEDLKTLSGLTANNGRLQTTPAQKRGLLGLLHWVKIELLYNRDPLAQAYPAVNTGSHITDATTFKKFLKESESTNTDTKFKLLTEETNWEDWLSGFMVALMSKVGRSGVP